MATASRHQISFGRFYLCKSFHADWAGWFVTLAEGAGSGVDLGMAAEVIAKEPERYYRLLKHTLRRKHKNFTCIKFHYSVPK